jgi:exosome complex RNA-binding protein Rrp42 (RNase PH superfamily)
MVTVTNYKERESKDGRKFLTLELTGGVEMVQSQTNGQWYATMRKTSIPCTFSEELAKQLIGTQMQGNIVKQEVEPYEYTNQRTGEVLKLNYNYSFQPNQSEELIGSQKVSEMA